MSDSARHPMPAQDSLWLHLDRPSNLMLVTSVLWTATPVDLLELREVVRERLLAKFPVFSQRPLVHTRPPRSAEWQDDPEFDLDRHLVETKLPAPGDKDTLEAFVAGQRSVPFDPAHPLWSIDLLQGYGDGSALVVRTHHVIADGIRLIQVLFSLLDPLDGADAAPASAGGGGRRRASVVHPAARVGAGAVRAVSDLGVRLHDVAARGGPIAQAAVAVPVLGAAAAVGLAGAAVDLVTAPLPDVPRRVFDAAVAAGVTVWNSAGSVAKLLSPIKHSPVWPGEPDVDKTAAWGDAVPFSLIAGIGHATGTTVNDVCTALVTAALDRYLRETPAGDVPARPRDVGWLVPVSRSSFDPKLPPELGNHFSLVLVRLPLHVAAFRDRLSGVAGSVARIRDSYEPALTAGIQEVVSRVPPQAGDALSSYLTDKAVGVLTNVPGPRAPMALAGAPVDGVVGWAPCSGRQALTVCVFSYAGQVFFGFGTDRRLIPDPSRLVAALMVEVEDARSLGA